VSFFLLYPIIFAASFILTMVGLGGGLIYAPLFILLEFPIHTALSASLFLNGIAALSAAITYYRKRMIDFHIGLPLIVSSTLCAPLGALMSAQIDLGVLKTILAVVMIAAALRMLFVGRPSAAAEPISAKRRILGGAFIGAAIGFIAGMLGIGGGVFIVPLLIFILKVPAKLAAATSIFIVVFSSFSGFIAHASLAQADWNFILLAAIFSFAGGQLGSRIMSEKLKSATVKKIFGLVLLGFAARLIQQTLF